MFHVSLLEPYKKTNDNNVPAPPSILVEREDEYEVKKILDNRIYRGKLQYLVKWLEYSHDKDQWVAKGNVAGSSELTKTFYKVYS